MAIVPPKNTSPAPISSHIAHNPIPHSPLSTSTHASFCTPANHTPHAHILPPQTIPGSEGNEVSSLAWARASGDPHWRLFASTLSGQIQELSPTHLTVFSSTDSSGGAVWCLRAAPAISSGSGSSGSSDGPQQQQLVTSQLAAACADGSVKLFGVHAGEAGAVFERALPRVEGNVLSLAWHPTGRSLVSGGSDGCMHVWDLQTGVWEWQMWVVLGEGVSGVWDVWGLADRGL
jgi:U3 small nucleolar RNA-associated protein 4